jgi:sugar phosphate isomerase/epimerase
MIQAGIFNGYFPYSLEEQARKIKSIGFNTVQLDLAFKDIDFSTVIGHARDFGTPYVISETGTFNPESDWVTDPKNWRMIVSAPSVGSIFEPVPACASRFR